MLCMNVKKIEKVNFIKRQIEEDQKKTNGLSINSLMKTDLVCNNIAMQYPCLIFNMFTEKNVTKLSLHYQF